MNKTNLQRKLFDAQDLKYQSFHRSLVPNIEGDSIIGVRVPMLRKIAKEFAKTKDAQSFLEDLPHTYYEENMIHSFLLCDIKEEKELIQRMEQFMPYIDNWAVCDSLRPKLFRKEKEALKKKRKTWLKQKHPYTKRLAIGMYLSYFLEDDFDVQDLEEIATVQDEEYYVKMMVAWYFATALAKQYEPTIPYLEKKRLEPWTHNKTIQKAIESYRITEKQKSYLRTLKVK